MRVFIVLLLGLAHALKRIMFPLANGETHTYIKNSSGILHGVYIRSGFLACYDGDCSPMNGVCYISGGFPNNTIFDTKGTFPIMPLHGIPFHTSMCCCTYCGGGADPSCASMIWFD